MNDDDVRNYAWQLYLRRLDRACQTERNCIELGGAPPDWVYDCDRMQANAWREARRFVATGSASTATCAGECSAFNDHNRSSYCPSKGPDGYCCTRDPGHAGPHEACGTSPGHHPIERWTED